MAASNQQHRVAIALGSNQGDREQILRRAIAVLATILDDLKTSAFHDTEPVGVGPQPRFLNAAATGLTALSAPAVLESLNEIETQFGRERPYPGAPRTLDLDLILYDDLASEEPRLTIPHARFRTRRFVLEPLAEIAPDWIDPITGLTVAELRAQLVDGS